MIDASKIQGSVAEIMLKPSVNVADGINWGLGWGLQKSFPNDFFYHWGSMAGFRHFVVGYSKEKIAVIVMTNSSKSFKVIDHAMAKTIGGIYLSHDWF